jgi:hypothetical protein
MLRRSSGKRSIRRTPRTGHRPCKSGTAESHPLQNWLVEDRGIEPYIPVFDKFRRTGGTFSREDFTFDHASDNYRCPALQTLQIRSKRSVFLEVLLASAQAPVRHGVGTDCAA